MANNSNCPSYLSQKISKEIKDVRVILDKNFGDNARIIEVHFTGNDYGFAVMCTQINNKGNESSYTTIGFPTLISKQWNTLFECEIFMPSNNSPNNKKITSDNIYTHLFGKPINIPKWNTELCKSFLTIKDFITEIEKMQTSLKEGLLQKMNYTFIKDPWNITQQTKC